MDKIQVAKHWKKQNITCLPAYPNSKYLLSGIKVRDYIDNPPNLPQFVGWWYSTKNNICLVADNGLTVIDFDSLSAYTEWLNRYQIDTYTISTKRGKHCYFWIDQPVNIDHLTLPEKVEVKCNGKVIMIPPSIVKGFAYQVENEKPIMRVDRIEDVMEVTPSNPSKEKNTLVTATVTTTVTTSASFSFSQATRQSTNLSPIASIKQNYPITKLFPDYYLSSNDGRMAIAHCPTKAHKNGDNHPSLSLDLTSNRAQCFKPDCPLHGKHGNDVIDCFAILNGLTLRQAIATLMSEIDDDT